MDDVSYQAAPHTELRLFLNNNSLMAKGQQHKPFFFVLLLFCESSVNLFIGDSHGMYCYQAVVKHSSGVAVMKYFLGSCQEVVRQSSGSHEVVSRQLSGN